MIKGCPYKHPCLLHQSGKLMNSCNQSAIRVNIGIRQVIATSSRFSLDIYVMFIISTVFPLSLITKYLSIGVTNCTTFIELFLAYNLGDCEPLELSISEMKGYRVDADWLTVEIGIPVLKLAALITLDHIEIPKLQLSQGIVRTGIFLKSANLNGFSIPLYFPLKP